MVSYVYDFNSQNRDLKYNKITNSSSCLGSFFRIPILLFKLKFFIFTSFISYFMSIAGQCGSYMPVPSFGHDSFASLLIAKAF